MLIVLVFADQYLYIFQIGFLGCYVLQSGMEQIPLSEIPTDDWAIFGNVNNKRNRGAKQRRRRFRKHSLKRE